MSAMANTTSLVTTVTKPVTNPRDADATPRVNIQEFCEEYYESAFDRLSETYSPSTTKSRPRGTDSRDRPRGKSRPHRLDTSNEDCPKDRERFRSVRESYDVSFSHSYRDENRSRHIKRRRDSESPLSSVSKSDSSNGRYWRSRSKRHKPMDEDDLTRPWMCEEEDPFRPRIRNFESSRRTRMPNNVKTYDGTGDPKDHLQGSQSSIPTYFMQQKKYVKDRVEIHNIKQKDRETIEDFMKRFKVETGRMKRAPEYNGRNDDNHHCLHNEENLSLLAKRKFTHHGRHRTSLKGKPQIKGLTFGVTQRKEGDLTGSLPLQGRQKRFLRPRREGRTELCSILKKNLDIFAWQSSDMKRVPRLVAKHRLNIREGYSPVWQKKRVQATERAKDILITSSVVSEKERTHPNNFKVALHPDFPDQEVAIGGTLSKEGRTELCSILKKNLDIFAWQSSDMKRVPRLVAKHRLNIREGYSPVWQKKRVQATERAKDICYSQR
nr:reverse transcriptase domain-containing protein [Tanacetum cinerariifolium]